MIFINRFIDKLKLAETKRSTNINLSLKEAQDLHKDITKLLVAVVAMNELSKQKTDEEVTKIVLKGEDW